jgi:hypothetical protein
MKTTSLIFLFNCSLFFAFGQSENYNRPNIVQEYIIVYVHEDDYRNEMYNHELEDVDLYKYYKKDNLLYPMFSSVEEAMANMRGFHKRPLVKASEKQTIYVLDDYCCGENAGFPNRIVYYDDNNIEGFK